MIGEQKVFRFALSIPLAFMFVSCQTPFDIPDVEEPGQADSEIDSDADADTDTDTDTNGCLDILGNGTCDFNDPDIIFWVDASLAASITTTSGTLADGKLVNVWADQSSYRNDLVTYNTTKGQATYVASHFPSGLGAVRFNNCIMEARGVDVRPSVVNEVTSFAAVQYQTIGDETLWVVRENGFSGRYHSGGTAYVDQVSVCYMNQKERTYRHFENGVLNVNDTAKTFDEAQSGIAFGMDLYAWHDYEGAYSNNLLIGEVIIFARTLSESERQTVELYLKTKWGL